MLEPVDGQGSYAGNDATFNVQLRVACALGNSELKSAEGEELGGRILRGGFLSRTTLTTANITTLRANDGTKYKTSGKLWADDYHLYEMEWKPDVVIVKVDGEAYGEKWFDSPLQTPVINHLSCKYLIMKCLMEERNLFTFLVIFTVLRNIGHCCWWCC